jgi:intracellular multiplication protein IcmL
MLTIHGNVNGALTTPWDGEAMARTEDVVRIIWEKESYAINRYFWVVRATAATMAMAVLCVVCTISLLQRPPVFKYVLTLADGTIREIVPLEEPKHDEDALTRWTTNVVLKAYTWDFLNYKAQFTKLQEDMTVYGWEEYKKSLEDSGNFKAVLGYSYVLTAVPNGPVTIDKAGLYSEIGRYAWKVKVPILVSYSSSAQRTNQTLMVTAVVVRQPEWINDAGLGVRSLIAELY